jgi:hypothetical protein
MQMPTVLLELVVNLKYKTKTLIFNLATRFWNKLHYVRSKSQYFFFKSLRPGNPKTLNIVFFIPLVIV